MEETIKKLSNCISSIEYIKLQFDRIGLEQGSSDQTRAMFIESIFETAQNNIEGAIKQLKILERELF